MKISKALKGILTDAKSTDSYWVETAKIQFALTLDAQRKAAGMTYKAVADALGTSAAYITKIFRGDSNLTLESMVRLARATGGRLEVRIVDPATAAQWDVAALQVKALVKQTATAASETVVTQTAGNDERFALAA